MIKPKRFGVLELSEEQRRAFLERRRPGHVIGQEDYRLMEGMIMGVPDLLALIEQKNISIGRLRRLIFGATTEKTSTVYALERLRCKVCGKLFTAPPPTEAGTQKYAENVGPLVAVFR